jgi:hypothetical protein
MRIISRELADRRIEVATAAYSGTWSRRATVR